MHMFEVILVLLIVVTMVVVVWYVIVTELRMIKEDARTNKNEGNTNVSGRESKEAPLLVKGRGNNLAESNKSSADNMNMVVAPLLINTMMDNEEHTKHEHGSREFNYDHSLTTNDTSNSNSGSSYDFSSSYDSSSSFDSSSW